MVAGREASNLFATRRLPEVLQQSVPTWAQVVASVDWSRVLIEAEGLHARVIRVVPNHKTVVSEEFHVCGACLKEVLLDKNWTPYSLGGGL